MRRLLIFVLLGASGVLCAADFRNATWGMTAEQVKKTEELKPKRADATEILYETHLGAQPVNIRYIFDRDGKLSNARYEFTQQYRESERYIFAYELLQNQLIRKYGAPAQEFMRCDDPFYADFPRRWGTGIVVGKLTKESGWNTSRLVVHHSIRALPGGQVGHVVEYSPVAAPTVELDSTLVYNAL